MNRSNYILGKRGMSLIAEALEHLQLSAFIESNSLNFEDVSKTLDTMQSVLNTTTTNKDEHINDVWERYGSEISKFKEAFEEFRLNCCEISKQFCYWDRFINQIASVLRDLKRPFLETNWLLHLASIDRSIPLCFAFDRVNHKRWLPIYYED